MISETENNCSVQSTKESSMVGRYLSNKHSIAKVFLAISQVLEEVQQIILLNKFNRFLKEACHLVC